VDINVAEAQQAVKALSRHDDFERGSYRFNQDDTCDNLMFDGDRGCDKYKAWEQTRQDNYVSISPLLRFLVVDRI
jgi:hypothetical protein